MCTTYTVFTLQYTRRLVVYTSRVLCGHDMMKSLITVPRLSPAPSQKVKEEGRAWYWFIHDIAAWSRGSYLYVPCRSICDQDRKYWIKQSKPLLGPIKVTSELPKSTIKNMQLQFGLWPLEIKRSRASEGNNQEHFCRSKDFITVANASTGDV